MSNEMLTILSLSISGSVLALILFAIKPLVKNKMSKAFSYYIWILVLLRLTVPVATPVNVMNTLFDTVSLAVRVEVPTAASDRYDTMWPQSQPETASNPKEDISISDSNAAQQPINQPIETQPTSSQGLAVSDVWSFIISNLIYIWAAGVAVSILWYVVSYLLFVRRLRKLNTPPAKKDKIVFREMRKSRNVRLKYNPCMTTPMLIGVFRPCIIVPKFEYVKNGMRNELENILRHELTHYKRKDIVYKWMVVFITSLHWFNPIMYFIRNEISRACELSCG